jgi:hypothetical protein
VQTLKLSAGGDRLKGIRWIARIGI